MEKRIIDMAQRTWQKIGGDYLIALSEEDLEPTMPREDVIEVLMDASQMKTHGEDDEAYMWFKDLSYKKQIVLMKKAFPLDYYGW